MDILRFTTAGNVDDGKSTLIGRLLYDTRNIKADVLESVTASANDEINLAHLTDGLRSERQQGITIDVAYKYFTTPHRKYIITDAPGHFQYTRNLVTGASNVDLMIVLIDAQTGITEQTRRHALVASFLKINKVVVAVNKMDLVGYNAGIFNDIREEFLRLATILKLKDVTIIPVSALRGDNVSFVSVHMPWYAGQTLEQYLEVCTPATSDGDALRFSVQYVANGADKCYAGKISSGKLKVGDTVGIYPQKHLAVVKKMMSGYTEITEAAAGENIAVWLESAYDALRGNVLSHPYHAPHCGDHFEASLCWLDATNPLQRGREYILRTGSAETACTIKEVMHKTDVHSFEQYNDDKPLMVNEFARVKIATKEKLAFDSFASLRAGGRGIIIDAETNYTSGAFVTE